jgi:hypothetical protein
MLTNSPKCTIINTQQQKGPTLNAEQAQAIVDTALKKYQLAQRQLQRAQLNPSPADMLRIIADSNYVSRLKLKAERTLKAVEYWQDVVDSKSYGVYDYAYFGKAYKLNYC